MPLKLLVNIDRHSPNVDIVHCVVIAEGSLRIEERPDPKPGVSEVLIATEFAGINAADLLQRRGLYPSPPGWPVDVPGMELSGRVRQVGEGVDESLLGAHVCAIVGAGAQATRSVVPAAHLMIVPDGVSLAAAGGFPEAFVTAFDALVRQARLKAGERMLVSGASGGVGVAAVQIGRLLGAHVTAVTRTAAHHDQLRALGADEVLAPSDVTSIAPVDVVLELVGAAHLSLALERLAPFARVVVIGVAGGGSHLEINLLKVMQTRSTLTGSTLRSRSHDEKADVIRHVHQSLEEAWSSGQLLVPMAKTFPMRDVVDAYEFFASPGKFGKVLLAMPGDA